MIRMLLISDGPRDEAVIPPLAERILNAPVKAEFKAWKDLHLGKGYGRKLKFAVRSAVSNRVKLLVATIDSDKHPTGDGLREMERVVSTDPNCQGLVYVALGEATPHAEAWLLDDADAVRSVLRLDQSMKVPTVRQVDYPKDTLDGLLSLNRGDDHRLDVLAEISRAIEPSRCQHAGETGFERFMESLEYAFRLAYS
jgi:hypothetical protein